MECRDDIPGNPSSQGDYVDHAIRVEEHGHEHGGDRFPEGSLPRFATWRNNLTALSQRRNLYFIAYWEKIYVYRPSQGQTLGAAPSLVLCPKPRATNIHGDISPGDPNGINHLVVGDLGNEEILAFATDSGDVAAYRTEKIFSVIDSCDDLEGTDPAALGKQVECFFSENVLQSAWGLAIHKHARLIAVGSNTAILTVFAFALVADSETKQPEEYSANELSPSGWYQVDDVAAFAKVRSWSRERRRAINIQLSFRDHHDNIPNISFLNNELDPHGDWLLSTDISNTLLIWKIWEDPRPVSYWRFQPPPHSHYADDIFDDHQHGWNVLALDPRAFRLKNNTTEACGGPPHRYPNNRAPYDLSFLAGRIPDATQYYDFFSSHGPPPGQYVYGEGAPSDESFSVSSFENSEEGPGPLGAATRWESDARGQVAGGNESDDSASASPTAARDDIPEIATNVHGYDPEMAHSEDLESEANSPAQDRALPEPLDPDPMESSDDGDTDIMPPEIVPYPDEDGIMPVYYTASSTREDEYPSLFSDFPILHFSATHIRLLHGPFSTGPAVVFRAALSQVLTLPTPVIENCDRMNMVHQIPELGLVIAASQKGRVAIISLTEVPGKGKMFRIDRILPFERQERHRFRPLVPLLGVAVGPVEGHLLPPEPEAEEGDSEPCSASEQSSDEGKGEQQNITAESYRKNRPFLGNRRDGFNREQWHGTEYSRRYRLYLTYYDHTILRYELYYDWPEVFRGPLAVDRPLVIRC